MALQAATTPLTITLVQGSADAFVQGSVLTGLTGRQAYNVKQIDFEFVTNVANGTTGEVSIAITRRSKTAMPTIADSDTIQKFSYIHSLVTSGRQIAPGVVTIFPQIEVPLVEETIYAQLDSTTTGLTITAVVRLLVEIDTMSDIDRLNLIARSLS